MKYLISLLLLTSFGAASAQIDLNQYTEPAEAHNLSTVLMPASPLKAQVLFIGGVDFVQTGLGDSTEARQYHDFIGFTPDTTGESLGWVAVNHETIQANDKTGDGGGMTVFRIKRDPVTDTLIVMNQTLSDGRSGRFFNIDFQNSVGESGWNCGGITSFVDGRLWTAEESFLTSIGEMYNGGKGIRDTADFVIGETTPNGFPGFNGTKIKRFENLSYMVEIDAREAVAVRKQYNWGRQAFEGGTVMPDNKTVYLGVDATPAFWLKFVANTAGDFTDGQLYGYKQDNAQDKRWVQLDNRSMKGVLSIEEQCVSAGCTMFNRIEWVTQDTTTGIVYLTETGRDHPARAWKSKHLAGATHAQHHLVRAAQQATHPDSTQYADYYGRVLAYHPAREEMVTHLAGGPEFFQESVPSSVYPEKHLSNPDGLSVITIGNQVYLIIQEDLNGKSYGRVPSDVTSNITCEMFLLNLSIEHPTVADLLRVTAVPVGAEITGATSTADGKTILVNCQHPNSDPNVNQYPYNNSLTFAITGWDQMNTLLTSISLGPEQGDQAFQVMSHPVSRSLSFEQATDAAIYTLDGQRLRVARRALSMDISFLSSGEYLIKNLSTGATRPLVIE